MVRKGLFLWMSILVLCQWPSLVLAVEYKAEIKSDLLHGFKAISTILPTSILNSVANLLQSPMSSTPGTITALNEELNAWQNLNRDISPEPASLSIESPLQPGLQRFIDQFDEEPPPSQLRLAATNLLVLRLILERHVKEQQILRDLDRAASAARLWVPQRGMTFLKTDITELTREFISKEDAFALMDRAFDIREFNPSQKITDEKNNLDTLSYKEVLEIQPVKQVGNDKVLRKLTPGAVALRLLDTKLTDVRGNVYTLDAKPTYLHEPRRVQSHDIDPLRADGWEVSFVISDHGGKPRGIGDIEVLANDAWGPEGFGSSGSLYLEAYETDANGRAVVKRAKNRGIGTQLHRVYAEMVPSGSRRKIAITNIPSNKVLRQILNQIKHENLIPLDSPALIQELTRRAIIITMSAISQEQSGGLSINRGVLLLRMLWKAGWAIDKFEPSRPLSQIRDYKGRFIAEAHKR